MLESHREKVDRESSMRFMVVATPSIRARVLAWAWERKSGTSISMAAWHGGKMAG